MEILKRPPDPKKAKAVRAAGYQRNMQAMRAYKETHPCCACGLSFPHPMMHFEKKGEWSIPRLAGSRCSLEDLEKAMRNTRLFCASHLPLASKPGPKRK